MDELEALKVLGLNGTEARLYAAIVKQGPLTGYEAAQRAGVVKSNAYDALRRLVARGFMTTMMQSGVARYAAVPVEDLVEKETERMRFAAQRLQTLLTSPPPPSGAVVGEGAEAMMFEARKMLSTGTTSAHVALSPRTALPLGDALASARKRGLRVEAACLSDCDAPCAVCTPQARLLSNLGQQNGLLVCQDREHVLAAQGQGHGAAFLIVHSGLLGHAVADLIEKAPPLEAPSSTQ